VTGAWNGVEGAREVSARRVVVGVSGSAGSLQALRYAAQLARIDEAALAPVLAWTPPGGDLAEHRCPNPELRRLWKQAASDRLCEAIELAIGGAPADIEFSPAIVRGEPGQALTEVAAEPGDVLVIGAGRRGILRRLLGCQVSKYCLAHARCPLVAVPPPQLASELRGLRGWVLRHRLQPEKVGLRTAGA
jgi:nucleotide-binding universal stress UspA family protein